MELIEPPIKRSYIADKELFKAVNYAITLMADTKDMSTKGAVKVASSKYAVTDEQIYSALGKDFKIAGQLLEEKREYRKSHPFKATASCSENQESPFF